MKKILQRGVIYKDPFIKKRTSRDLQTHILCPSKTVPLSMTDAKRLLEVQKLKLRNFNEYDLKKQRKHDFFDGGRNVPFRRQSKLCGNTMNGQEMEIPSQIEASSCRRALGSPRT